MPYQADGKLEPEHREYTLRQLRDTVIPALGEGHGAEVRFRRSCATTSRLGDGLRTTPVAVLCRGKSAPPARPTGTSARCTTGPIFGAFRGTQEGVDYYRRCARKWRSARCSARTDHA